MENGKLFILETRPGRRTPQASVRVAVALVHEKLLTEREALIRIDPKKMDFFLHPVIDPAVAATGLSGLTTLRIGQGFAASPGAAVGYLAFSFDEVRELAKKGMKSILCLEDAQCDDDDLLCECEGLLIMGGGVQSSLCVAARQLGKPTIVGARISMLPADSPVCSQGMQIQVHAATNTTLLLCSDGKTQLRKGDLLTVDGTHGVLYNGSIPTVPAGQDVDYQTLLRWADKYKRMTVLSVADDENEVVKAMSYGADGIGMCQSTNMFFKFDRTECVSALLFSSTEEERAQILSLLLPLHRQDFLQMFRHLHNKRCSIVLIDPRAQDFLPKCPSLCTENFEEEVKGIANRLAVNQDEAILRAKALAKQPGRFAASSAGELKGDTRMWAIYPDVTEMQVRAILGAAIVAFAEGITVYPEILLPSIFTEREIDLIKPVIEAAAQDVFAEAGFVMGYRIGTMIDTPRACMRADIIGKRGMDMLCFDLGSLTKHTYGTSHQNMQRFLVSSANRSKNRSHRSDYLMI